MKRFTVPCQVNGKKVAIAVYVGHPAAHCHPLAAQRDWLKLKRNIEIPGDILKSFQKLWDIAKENNVPDEFAQLCVDALASASADAKSDKDSRNLRAVVSEKIVMLEKYNAYHKKSAPKISAAARAKEHPSFRALSSSAFKYSSENDLLLCGDLEQLTQHLYTLAELIHGIADKYQQTLFVCLCLQSMVCAENPASIVQVYKEVAETEDFSYKFALAVDTWGGKLPLFCNNFMWAYAVEDKVYSNKVFTELHANLVRFAVNDLPLQALKKIPKLNILHKNLRTVLFL